MKKEKTPPPCDRDIYAHGTLLMTTHTIPSADIEAWVRKVAARSGQRVDWHYAGGRACVLALGNLAAVRKAIDELLPEHDELQRRAALAILPDLPFTPSCVLYEEGTMNPAHEYVRQLNIEREAPS